MTRKWTQERAHSINSVFMAPIRGFNYPAVCSLLMRPLASGWVIVTGKRRAVVDPELLSHISTSLFLSDIAAIVHSDQTYWQGIKALAGNAKGKYVFAGIK